MINVGSLNNPKLITQLYQRYYINDSTPKEYISSHWEKFSPRISVHIDEQGNLTQFKGYGFGDIQYTNPITQFFNRLCNLSYLIKLPYKKELKNLIGKIKPELKKIDTYVSFDCFRQINSFILIRKYLDMHANSSFNILNIGDGFGFLSFLLKKMYPESKILLVDIGKVLFFQCINLQRAFPELDHLGALEGNDFYNYFNKAGFIYCPVENLNKITQLKYKVIINISSFQEMNITSINGYFKYMRKYACDDNLFYCCNRKSKNLPQGEIVEFDKYPWHKKDRFCFDEEPKFYKYFLSPKFPFLYYFDGPMRHCLVNLFLTGA